MDTIHILVLSFHYTVIELLLNDLLTLFVHFVIQVRTLVNELCRITVLWDEFWLGSLGQLNATAAERIKALASEVC